jgi:hypothetical protein
MGWRTKVACGIVAASLGLYLSVIPVAARGAPSTGSASITGTVYSAAGLPLARAVVTAYALPGLRAGCLASPDEWRAVASATTRSNGAFAIAGVAQGFYRIGVVPKDPTKDAFGYRVSEQWADGSADGTANVTSWVGFADDVTAPGPAADVYLAEPASFGGRITDAESGNGLPGIEARAVTTGQWQRVYPVAKTDATGSYAVRGLPLGVPDPTPGDGLNEAQRYGPVLVDPNGWHGVFLWWFDDLDTGRDSTIDLTQGASPYTYDHTMRSYGRATVTVVDPSGRPVPGVAVTLDSAFPWPPQRTNAKGKAFLGTGGGGEDQYTLNAFMVQDHAGVYRTTWSGGSPTWSTAQKIPMQPDRDNAVRIVVRPDAATLITSVAYWSGDPYRAIQPDVATGVQMVLPGATENDWAESMSASSVHCDGTVEIQGLWPGLAMDFLVMSVGDDPAVTTGTYTLAPGVNHIGTQRLSSWIFGVWVEGPGGPIPGASVQLYANEGDGYVTPLEDPTASSTTDEGGYARSWLPFEPWWQGVVIHVSGDGFSGFIGENGQLVSDPTQAVNLQDPDGFDRQAVETEVWIEPEPAP